MLATGAAPAWELALAAADRGATIQLFAPSGPGERRAFDVDDVFFRELEIQASYSAGPRDTREALDLIATGAIPAERARHPPLPARAHRGGARGGAQPRGHEGDRHEQRVRAAVLHAPGDLRIDSVRRAGAGARRGRARGRRGAQLRHRRQVRAPRPPVDRGLPVAARARVRRRRGRGRRGCRARWRRATACSAATRRRAGSAARARAGARACARTCSTCSAASRSRCSCPRGSSSATCTAVPDGPRPADRRARRAARPAWCTRSTSSRSRPATAPRCSAPARSG